MLLSIMKRRNGQNISISVANANIDCLVNMMIAEAAWRTEEISDIAEKQWLNDPSD